MKEQKNCDCGKGDKNLPKDVKVETMVTPDDFGKMPAGKTKPGVSEAEVEESVVMVNPDVESMDSRG